MAPRPCRLQSQTLLNCRQHPYLSLKIWTLCTAIVLCWAKNITLETILCTQYDRCAPRSRSSVTLERQQLLCVSNSYNEPVSPPGETKNASGTNLLC